MKILALTDFSEVAHSALLNAVKLARCYGAELFFLHAMSKPIVPATSPEDVYRVLYEAEREQSMQRLQEESRRLYQEAGLKPSELLKNLIVEPTPLSDTILQIVAKHNIDLVIMGTSGNNGLKRLLFGSSSLEMIQLTPVPLLIVPKSYTFSGFKNITIVIEHKKLCNRSGFRILERFAHTFSSVLDFVWVPEKDDDSVPSMQRLLFSDGSGEMFKTIPYQLKVLPKGSAKEKLKEHLNDTAADLIVNLPEQDDLWSNTVSGSLTEEIASKLKIPMLVIPQQNTE